jgi:hypothetical protein
VNFWKNFAFVETLLVTLSQIFLPLIPTLLHLNLLIAIPKIAKKNSTRFMILIFFGTENAIYSMILCASRMNDLHGMIQNVVGFTLISFLQLMFQSSDIFPGLRKIF